MLRSPAGDYVELSVTGYQYGKSPSVAAGGWDENWLNISGQARSGTESWAFRDPCLTTWEARDLLGWLRRAVESTPEPIDFTEPNLSFGARVDVGSQTAIVVTLKGEAAPPSASDGNRWGSGCALTLDVTRDALAEAADAWESELDAYPPR